MPATKGITPWRTCCAWARSNSCLSQAAAAVKTADGAADGRIPDVLRILLLGMALLPAAAAIQPEVAADLGVRGYVVDPDGTPVSAGRVVVQSFAARATTSIEETGRFLIVPAGP